MSRSEPSPSLLILTENFYPTESSGGRLMTALAEDLVANGMDVTAYASRSGYRGQRRVATRDEYRGIRIRRLPAGRFARDRPVGRLVNEMVLTLSMFLAVLLRSRVDRILVTSSPPFLAPAIALAASIRRIELFYVVMDVYPEMAAATGLLERGSFFYRGWEALSRFACRRATRVVVLGRCMKGVVAAKVGDLGPQPVVLPNWADGREIHPLAAGTTNRFFEKYPGLEGKFIVQYSGNFGRFHDFETVLQAADRLRGREDVKFVLIGQGARRPWLEREIARRKLGNVELLPFQPQNDLPHSLAAQSVSLVTLERGTEGLCVPSKFYPVLAAGKPVIAVMDSTAEVARVVEEERIGIVVSQYDADALVSAIERLSASPELVREMGARARCVQQKRFDRLHAVERYRRLLNPADQAAAGDLAPDEPVQIVEADEDDLARLVEMHLHCLGPGANLASLLGPEFVRAAYRWFLTAPEACVIKSTVGGQIAGFTTLCDVPYTVPMLSACRKEALRCLSRRPWLLFNSRLLQRILRRPRGIGAREVGPGIAQVGFTAVLPGFRGRGVGSGLKEASIRICHGRGSRGLMTGISRDNAASIALNERFGFREVEGAETPRYRYYLLRFPSTEAGVERSREAQLAFATAPSGRRPRLQGTGR